MEEEFEEFFESQIRKMHTGYSGMKAAWLEATRRADRKAREEFAEICRQRALSASADYGFCDGDTSARSEAAKCCCAIRATIPEV